jgi:hypothetical protein
VLGMVVEEIEEDEFGMLRLVREREGEDAEEEDRESYIDLRGVWEMSLAENSSAVLILECRAAQVADHLLAVS